MCLLRKNETISNGLRSKENLLSNSSNLNVNKTRREIVKMLKTKKFIKFFWLFVRFFGLQPHKLSKREKIRSIFIFVVLYVWNILLHIVKLVTTKSAEERIQGIQTSPMLIIMLADGINFALKSKEIEELFDEMCETINESGEEKLFNETYNKTMRIVNVLIGFMFASLTLNTVVFYITAKSGVPIYIPIDHGPIFIAIWLVQNLFFCYCTSIFLLLDFFLFTTLGFLNANAICIGKNFKKMIIGNKKEIVKCLENHQKFKG
jgi:hypothetical protein